MTKSEESARRTAWAFRHIVKDLICEAFTSRNLRRDPARALRVQFRLHDALEAEGGVTRDGGTVSLWLWAPMNYVGVYRDGEAGYRFACPGACDTGASFGWTERQARVRWNAMVVYLEEREP